MIHYPLTMESYDQLQSWLCRQVSMRVRHKDSSILMRMAARHFVSRFAQMPPDLFMRDFCTTLPVPLIGTTAFLTWEPYGTYRPPEQLTRESIILLHEAVHAHQIRWMGGDTFSARYLGDAEYRAVLEVEAYRVQIALTACATDTELRFPVSAGPSDPELDALCADKANVAAEHAIEALQSYRLPDAILQQSAKQLRHAARYSSRLWRHPLLSQLVRWASDTQ